MTPTEIRDRLLEAYEHGTHHDFRGITCDALLDLSGCRLSGVDFSGAKFPKGINAAGTQFQGLSWFGGAEIGEVANFSETLFLSDARFEDARFSCEAGFDSAEFRGVGRFDRTLFEQGADFGQIVCYGNFSLQDLVCDHQISFSEAEWLGGLWCQDTELPRAAILNDTQIHGRLWLRNAMLGDRSLKTEDFGLSFGYTYL